MTEKRSSNSFKSYVGLDDETQSTNNDDSFSENLAPVLLPGEVVIAEAQNVLMFTQISERKQGKSGILCVTNFKLSFITSEERQREEVADQEKMYLGEYDICLTNVDSVYLLGDKKRKLLPGKVFTEKVKGLHIVCKTMKVLTFSFKFSPVGHGKTLATALLHHAFPKRHQLLFPYDYTIKQCKFKTETRLFREAGDWGKELARTECQGWRLSSANHEFHMSSSLPQWIVVPSAVLDWQLNEAARHFRGGRPPTWSWSSYSGAALVKMADIVPSISDRVQENIMLESVRKSHPRLSQPIVMDLTKDLPSPKDVLASFIKLRDLCAPEDVRQFWIQDNHYLSLLEGTKWLQYVSSCLCKANDAAKKLHRESTVVLQESDGRDMCCLISSLAQILIDPYFRTVHGFQSLIQKEWVVMGHPFCTRLGHIYNEHEGESPMILLFLDCVWQLLQQFPTYFQFTETYLTSLWEAAHVSLFDTFLFDCERDRVFASKEPNDPLILRSVWDENLGYQDSTLFYNPLYSSLKKTPRYPLPVCFSIPCLDLWQQCYLRHIPLLEIIGGGNPQVDLECRLLMAQLENGGGRSLELEPPHYGGGSRSPGGGLPLLELSSLSQVGSFFPFSPLSSRGSFPPSPILSTSLLLSSLSLNQSFHSTEAMLDSQSPLNSPD